MISLDGKTAIITGAGAGIGRAATHKFAAAGANVLAVDINEDGLQATVTESKSNAVSYFVADVTQQQSNDAMAAECVERFGGVDCFVANAGIEGQVTSILEYDEAIFDKVMAVNVKGVFLGIRSVVPRMQARGGGAIVITSSVAGLSGAPSIAPYSTSKHAVIGLMRSAAKEFAPMNIRVNTVNPGPIETRMMRSLESGMGAEHAAQVKAQISSRIPVGRYGEPDEIANVMRFLCSDDASFITGAVYAVDGANTA